MRVITARELERAADAPASDALRRCIHSARCTFAGVTIELRTDVAELIPHFIGYYSAHVTGERPDFTYHVVRMAHGYTFWGEHAGGYQWRDGELPPDALMFLTDACAIAAVIAYDRNLGSIHAAAVEWNGSASIIAGNSTAGKTTTLLACARSGMRVYSDERALLRGDVLHPFVRRCSVRDGGKRILMADYDDDVLAFALRKCATFSLTSVFGDDVVAIAARLRNIFVLDGYELETVVEPITATQAVRALTEWFDAAGNGMERIARALSLARGARCYRLRLGTPEGSAGAIRALSSGNDIDAVAG